MHHIPKIYIDENICRHIHKLVGAKMGELDPELDEREVVVEAIYYCGKCNTQMKKLGATTYRCPECGEVYRE